MRGLFVGTFVLVLTAAVATADVIPGGDFESGATPTGFTAFGNTAVVSSVGSDPFILPGNGTSFVMASSGGSGPVSAGTGPASFFTGDPAGTGDGINSYSGFSFSLNVPVASILSFLVNIGTGEISGGVADVIAVYVDPGSGAVPLAGAVIGSFQSLNSPFGSLDGAEFDGTGISDGTFGDFSDGQTGWDMVYVPIAPGSYTVYFLVADADDSVVDTGAGVDDISLQPVPEPGTWLLFGVGLLGFAGHRRLRRRAARAPRA